MTSPFETLEQSLRAGPPDESGYRTRPLDLPTAVANRRPAAISAWAPTQVEPYTRPGTALRTDRGLVGTPWRELAAAVVVAIGVVAAGSIGLANRANVGRPAWSGTGLSPLTERFTSPQHGYSIAYPAGWTVVPAMTGWAPNTDPPVMNPAYDRLELPGTARLIGASQPLGAGQTEDDWLAAYFPTYPKAKPCPSDRSTWPRLQVDGATVFLVLVDCPTNRDGQVAPNDLSYEALAFAGGRVYELRLNGNVDRADFEAILATMIFDPVHAVD